jgi:hypothetical protein
VAQPGQVGVELTEQERREHRHRHNARPQRGQEREYELPFVGHDQNDTIALMMTERRPTGGQVADFLAELSIRDKGLGTFPAECQPAVVAVEVGEHPRDRVGGSQRHAHSSPPEGSL